MNEAHKMEKRRFVTQAMVELRTAITEAEQLSAKAELTKRDEQRINVLLAKIAALKSGAVAPDDYNERFWRNFLTGHAIPQEKRATDLVAGTQSLTFGNAAAGGV